MPKLAFAQFTKGKCHCCGEKEHTFQDCPKRKQLTKDKWWINKQDGVPQYNQVISEIQNHFITEANTASNNGAASTASTSSSTNSSLSTPENSWINFMFSAVQRGISMRDTIVLDSGSSVDLFCNQEWLHNVNSNGSPLTIQTNGGGLQVAQQGHLPQYGMVPYDD